MYSWKIFEQAAARHKRADIARAEPLYRQVLEKTA
jgi:hypothetical protein